MDRLASEFRIAISLLVKRLLRKLTSVVVDSRYSGTPRSQREHRSVKYWTGESSAQWNNTAVLLIAAIRAHAFLTWREPQSWSCEQTSIMSVRCWPSPRKLCCCSTNPNRCPSVWLQALGSKACGISYWSIDLKFSQDEIDCIRSGAESKETWVYAFSYWFGMPVGCVQLRLVFTAKT